MSSLTFRVNARQQSSAQQSQQKKPAVQNEALKNVGDVVQAKPFKFSPFQVSPSNKVDYALARLDDLLNFARRVRKTDDI